jgi:hypothetical protein
MSKEAFKVAKAGEKISAKAMAKLRKLAPRVFGTLTTKESVTVQPKNPAVQHGQWICADCGEVFQNNMGAHWHEPESHRRVWWTGEHFEEP